MDTTKPQAKPPGAVAEHVEIKLQRPGALRRKQYYSSWHRAGRVIMHSEGYNNFNECLTPADDLAKALSRLRGYDVELVLTDAPFGRGRQ